jgi:acetyl/propionyl-CoA carboxylase alpha subunit
VFTDQALLVANRGEIAVRIFKTAKRLGMRTIAVYSDADDGAPHAREADEALRIGPAPAAESYLALDRIIDAAKRSEATLIHPGYGFLAEDDRFADACELAGLTFVGPSSDVLRLVGDKASARILAERNAVPVLRGYAGDDQSDDALIGAATDIGYPVLVKPAAGGGGKGMHVVDRPDELVRALDAARRIARAAFDDDRLILERYIRGPRHVEVQVFADAHGTVVHLGERDCSLQRRHQKVMEESPAPNLSNATRAALHDAAVSFARAAGYRNAGTCEFLVAPDGTFGFIEMNARLQVEHPVTEAVTGLDLVEWQLRVALGERLGDVASPVGHAFEVRIYAEDPDVGSLPQTGRILRLVWPDGARVDTGIEEGTDITSYYDPLLAKLIVHGSSRDDALARLHDALDRTAILGVRTNLPFLGAVVRDDVAVDGRITTDWLEHAYARWRCPRDEARAARVAASAEVARLRAIRDADPWRAMGSWRALHDDRTFVVVRDGETEYAVRVDPNEQGEATAVRYEGRWYVWLDGAPYEFDVGPAPRRSSAAAAHLDAPLPGRVRAVRVASGDDVSNGEELVVIEAMKMEHVIRAPSDGVVRTVLCAVGDQVERGQALVDFVPSSP